MEEINQNSQTSLDFNSEKFEPKEMKSKFTDNKILFKKNLPIEIVGNRTKIDIGKKFNVQKLLDMSKFSGIIDYKPEELYITVKAGTSNKYCKRRIKKK